MKHNLAELLSEPISEEERNGLNRFIQMAIRIRKNILLREKIDNENINKKLRRKL